MANSGSGADRITCPRCRANNFAGKTHCWQCSAPLTPPEAAGWAYPAGQPRSQGTAAQRQNSAGGQFSKAGSDSRPDAQPARPAYGGGAGPRSGIYNDEFVRKWGFSRGIALLLVAVVIATFLAVWAIAGRMRGGSDVVRTVPTPAAPVFAPPSQEAPAARPAAVDESDPIVAESKRFIERESRHANLPEPPASSDGRVYLRGGGSISADQYRDAQRRVQESPVLHTPIPAPPGP